MTHAQTVSAGVGGPAVKLHCMLHSGTEHSASSQRCLLQHTTLPKTDTAVHTDRCDAAV
jgi:hypothetical protein